MTAALAITITGQVGRLSFIEACSLLGDCADMAAEVYAVEPGASPSDEVRVFARPPFAGPVIDAALAKGLELGPGLTAKFVQHDAPEGLVLAGAGAALVEMLRSTPGMKSDMLPAAPPSWVAKINAIALDVGEKGFTAGSDLRGASARQPQALAPPKSIAVPAPPVASSTPPSPPKGALTSGARFVADGIESLTADFKAGKLTPANYKQKLSVLANMGGY